MDSALQIDAVAGADAATLDLAGELTAAEGHLLYNAVNSALAGGTKCVRLRMTNVSFLDSSGISELLRVRDIVRATGSVLQIARPSPTVMKVLTITSLTSIFDIVDVADDPGPVITSGATSASDDSVPKTVPLSARGFVKSSPVGRTCAEPSCEQALSRYNENTLCWKHVAKRNAANRK